MRVKIQFIIYLPLLVFHLTESRALAQEADLITCPAHKDSSISEIVNTERKYFENLLRKGMDAPLEEFFHLWNTEKTSSDPKDPKQADADDRTYFLNCLEQDETTFNFDVLKERHCESDVLYSWGSLRKLETIQHTLKDGLLWSGNPNPYKTSVGIWATFSPVSTFNYGLIPIRFKLKKETSYVIEEREDGSSPGIYTFPNLDLMDFIISDGRYIESWSFGTAELYDEIVKDILRIRSGKKVLTYFQLNPDIVHTKDNINRVFKSGVPENERQTEEVLKRRLLELIRMILADEGHIYYQGHACPSRQMHYSTEKPTYFNQK